MSWNSAISACVRCSEWRHAADLVGRLTECDVNADSFTAVGSLSACERACKWTLAVAPWLKALQVRSAAVSEAAGLL